MPHRLRRRPAPAPNCATTRPSPSARWKIPRSASRPCAARSASSSPIGCWSPPKISGHGLLREAHHSAAGRVVYLAHTPQFFPSAPPVGTPTAAAADLVAQSAGHRRHRPPHGRLHRARTGAPRRGDPSADLRRRPVPRLRQFRSRARHHDQSLRGEGHLDLPRSRRAPAGLSVRRRAGLGHHRRGPPRARTPAQRASSCPTPGTSTTFWRARASC